MLSRDAGWRCLPTRHGGLTDPSSCSAGTPPGSAPRPWNQGFPLINAYLAVSIHDFDAGSALAWFSGYQSTGGAIDRSCHATRSPTTHMSSRSSMKASRARPEVAAAEGVTGVPSR